MMTSDSVFLESTAADDSLTDDFEMSSSESRGHIVLSVRYGPNATALREVLEAESLVCVSAPSVEAIADAIEMNAALVVVTEEVLSTAQSTELLSQRLNQQPEWSDIPVIVLMRECRRFPNILGLLSESAYHRSVLLLELPLKRPVFIAMVRACLRNRERQYLLRDTLERLKESNQTLESFSYTAAHELRNPLGVVKSSFDLLARMALDKKQEKIVKMGQRTASSMNRMLSVLLDYGKVRSQSVDSFTAVDMNGVVTESVSNCQLLIKERDVAFSLADLPKVRGSRQLLIQLVSNLVKNAIVHNDAEVPEVSISVEAQSSNRFQPARWLFSVSDNGPGIAPENQEKIFAMFNRAGRSRAEGSGIGLALCRRVVEQHQGAIGVRSTVGDGSTFYFDLAKVEESNE